MKKLIIGLTLAAVCGVGVTTWASTNSNTIKSNLNSVLVTPVENTSNSNENITVNTNTSTNTNYDNVKSEIESYIESKYGSNWANDLYAKNGDNWDDILEDELEIKFGEKYDDLIDNIIDAKEKAAGLDNDDLDDLYDNDDINDHDDIYDDHDDNDHDDHDDIYDLD